MAGLEPTGNKVKKKPIAEKREEKTLAPGQILKSERGTEYLVECLLGAGGFGEVWKVSLWNNPDKRYALKTEPNFAEQKCMLRLKCEVNLFEEIAKASNRIDKTHFVRMHDRGKTAVFKYLVMDLIWLSLKAVKEKICGDVFSPHTLVNVARQTLKGIESLHEVGYLHRDIKPDNFAVGLPPKDNIVYLLDFGIARPFLDEAGEMRKPRREVKFLGTIRYASVENFCRREQSMRDDLEVWLYMMVEFYDKNNLIWGFLEDSEVQTHIDLRSDLMTNSREMRTKKTLKVPEKYCDIIELVREMDYDEEGDFPQLNLLLTQMCIEEKIDESLPLDWVGKKPPSPERPKRREEPKQEKRAPARRKKSISENNEGEPKPRKKISQQEKDRKPKKNQKSEQDEDEGKDLKPKKKISSQEKAKVKKLTKKKSSERDEDEPVPGIPKARKPRRQDASYDSVEGSENDSDANDDYEGNVGGKKKQKRRKKNLSREGSDRDRKLGAGKKTKKSVDEKKKSKVSQAARASKESTKDEMVSKEKVSKESTQEDDGDTKEVDAPEMKGAEAPAPVAKIQKAKAAVAMKKKAPEVPKATKEDEVDTKEVDAPEMNGAEIPAPEAKNKKATAAVARKKDNAPQVPKVSKETTKEDEVDTKEVDAPEMKGAEMPAPAVKVQKARVAVARKKEKAPESSEDDKDKNKPPDVRKPRKAKSKTQTVDENDNLEKKVDKGPGKKKDEKPQTPKKTNEVAQGKKSDDKKK